MRPVKQRLRAIKRDVPHREVDASVRRDRKRALLEAEAELAEEELATLARPHAMLEGEVAQAAPKASTPGYTQAGPLALNPAYAGKSDLDRAAQMMRDLDLEPGTSHGIRVLRAASPYGRKR